MVQGSYFLVIPGVILLMLKNILDKVDGSLARAKGITSRKGRFYDSISDFIVSSVTFGSIGYYLFNKYNEPIVFLISFAGLISSMMQTSFFIYYLNSFLIATNRNTINRLRENVTLNDLESEDKLTLKLQRIFQLIYGWQDTFIYKVDKKLLINIKNEKLWYTDKKFLTALSVISIGTHIFLISAAALTRMFEVYLVLNLILLNLYLILILIIHYISVKKQ